MKHIGQIRSLLTSKFSVPRQSNLVNEMVCQLELFPPYDNPQATMGLEGFTHLWLIGIFHENVEANNQERLMVRPPRLGGNQKVGVFASRSSFRPNNLSLSLVRLKEVRVNAQGKVSLILQGCDLVNGTPILDIKPYIPFADQPLAGQEVRAGYVQAPDFLLTSEVEVGANAEPQESSSVIEQIIDSKEKEVKGLDLLFASLEGVSWHLDLELISQLKLSPFAVDSLLNEQEQNELLEIFARVLADLSQAEEQKQVADQRATFSLALQSFATLTPEERVKVVYLSKLLAKLLILNPKPAYKNMQTVTAEYGMEFAGLNIRWQEQQDLLATPEKQETQPVGKTNNNQATTAREAVTREAVTREVVTKEASTVNSSKLFASNVGTRLIRLLEVAPLEARE
ncbi:tRNA (N6-threonylcarbamoyladenosine(37)-N6)-methyltransferase TrmO [Psittacicella hinzii]|uniref:tRNA (N6-threonylcarbamoyladenosine(37)-N6)-methyltransferase TrmO n=1 Tax=Psittacicella hinzii TaxID=2028575 RepID=A0A3A1Y418_9GAMM|nr:tRNA (N6-threonylcarbamoyladenosine(37)-N6)-methyltransferase TrmO [Psittacicella hinzii]RIY31968.1 tRNA (N6-threonylcarbamoyladenosine(37)-N6)-methyltransferase TrmO [Psittacicella hinzii]